MNKLVVYSVTFVFTFGIISIFYFISNEMDLSHTDIKVYLTLIFFLIFGIIIGTFFWFMRYREGK